jgi:hypothetical protein
MEHWWNDSDREKSLNTLGGKTCPLLLCPPKIPHGLTWDRTQASTDDCLSHDRATTFVLRTINLHIVTRVEIKHGSAIAAKGKKDYQRGIVNKL